MRARKSRRGGPARGAHIRVDHTRALVHPREPVRPPADGERPRAQLGERVRRHERVRGVLPRGEARRERGPRGGERAEGGEDRGDGDVLADHARGHDERFARALVLSRSLFSLLSLARAGRVLGGRPNRAEERIRRPRHLPRAIQPLRPRHGVRAPAVDHHRARPAAVLPQHLLRDEDRRRFERVAGEARRCGGGARRCGQDDGQVERGGFFLDAGVDAGEDVPGWKGFGWDRLVQVGFGGRRFGGECR